ncbi:DNA/RNA non-specific endonuclease [Streptomyces sp. NPDC014983]|uniref:DNA/RNA non-specific endonuclease n=1 Tax=Streptomyces sp. NPDC014983 TaxID=3364933 RepID=UPI0036FF1BEE
MSALPAVNLSMVYAPAEHAPMTRANLTVNSAGQASGTLSEPVTGKSTLAWSGDQLYLKGDSAFWAQQNPQFGHDLTSTGHWVAPEKRSGYYMLDSFGVNAGSLTPASLAALVRKVTSDPGAVRQDGATFQGRKAVSYTSQGWTVLLSDESPSSVLAIGGDPGGDSPVKSATWHPARRTGRAAKPAGYRTNAVAPKPATPEQTAAVRTTTASAVATAVPPATSAEAVSKTMGPAFTITSNDAYLCTTNPCSYSITVTNSGDRAGDATLYLNMPQVPTGPHPLGTLRPKQSRTVSGTRPNIAPPGKTVTFTDYAWVYSTAAYGPDPEVGSRLHARNLRPDDLSFSTPLQPTVAGLLDVMTKDRPTSDTEAGSRATDAIETANDQGELPDLGKIVGSGRLNNPQDLRDILPTTEKVADQRVLQQIALLLQTDPRARVTWTAPAAAGKAAPPADYLYTTTEQGRQVKRAVKAETVRSPAELGSRARLGAAQLNGEQPDSGTAGGRKVRPGYERVLRLDLEASVGPLLDLATTQDLEHTLSTDPRFQPLRDSLCEPNGAGPRVNRLVVVNASGTHQWTSPRQVGANCGSSSTPASPDSSSSSGPTGEPTCLTQRPPNVVDESSEAGWIKYGQKDVGHGGRATGASACLTSAYLKDHPGSSAADREEDPVGYAWARRYLRHLGGRPSAVNACHLLGAQLGGSGKELENLVTCGTDANSYVGKPKEPIAPMDSMLHFEDKVRKQVDDGYTVLYQVAPVYEGSRTVPARFQMSYISWNKDGVRVGADSEKVSNLVRTDGSGWKNLGTAVDGRTGVDVPLAGD